MNRCHPDLESVSHAVRVPSRPLVQFQRISLSAASLKPAMLNTIDFFQRVALSNDVDSIEPKSAFESFR